MKILKRLLAIIAIIILIPLVAALFITKDFSIEREITINKPRQEVFNYIKQVKNSANYNYWWMLDPNAKHEYRGTDGSVGFVAAWDSENKNMGAGEQEIKSVTDGEKVECELRFKKPMAGTALTYMATEPLGDNQTKVKWVFSATHPYPMNFLNIFMDKILGGALQTSLNNLKTILEK